MSKIIYLMLFLFSFNLLLNAAEPGSEWWGQNGTWSSDATTNALKCDATTNWGGANNWIATTFGTAGPWKDMTVKFDFYMPNSGNAIIWQFGQAGGDWANGGVKVQFNYYGIFAYNPSWAGGVTLLDANFGTSVHKYKLNGWNTAVINISATGVVSVKLNGVNGSSSFTVADINTLSGEYCSINYQYAAGYDFQMRNVEVTKGAINKKYFTCTPTAYTNMNMFSSTNAWFPISIPEAVGPDNSTGGWYTVTTPGAEKIKYDGTITPTLTGIRTEKAALADEWWGTTIKFKAEVDAAGGTTTYKVGSNGVWNTRANGGRCIMLNVNKYEIQILPEHEYGEAVQLWAWNSPTTYVPYSNSGPFDFEIIISDAATHTITVKINGVSAPVNYNVTGVALNRLNSNGPMYFEVYPAASPFEFSNVEMKKAGVAKTYFPTLNYVIAATANNGALGSVTGAGTYQKSSDVTLTATPIAGNHFINWTEAGVEVSTATSYNLLNISAARTLVANFEPDALTLSSGQTIASSITYTTTNIVVPADGELIIDANKTFKSVSVTAGGKLTLGSNTLTTTNGITLQSDGTGTATLTGDNAVSNVTVQQYLGSARNWYVSSPVSSTLSPATNIAYYYEYVEAGDNNPAGQPGSSTEYWKGLATGTSMAVGKGFIAKATAGTTIQFTTGTPNNGNITTSFNLTRNDAKGKGFNLVGNPYPSYIDWTDVAAANPNLENTYYYRTKNTDNSYAFITWNGSGNTFVNSKGGTANTTITRFIPPTQAFWVRVKSGTSPTQMYFNNGMREHRDNNGNLMKAPNQNTHTSLRLQLQNGNQSDETLIYFDADAANLFDNYDSPKMLNNTEVTPDLPDLYSIAGNEKLVINGLNQVADNLELPLGFTLKTAANGLKLKVSELSNFAIGAKVYLVDSEKNTQTELLPETEYSFDITEATSYNESRFSLLFRAPSVPTALNNAEKDLVKVHVNADNLLVIDAPVNSIYSIYNALGQLIENGKLITECRTRNTKLSAGLYVVKVNNILTRVILK